MTNLAEHAIETGNAAPIKQHPRRVPLAHAKAKKQAIEDLKAKGVIRESTSPWASPIVLVAKKDGGVRPCVDYRRVNQLVKPDGPTAKDSGLSRRSGRFKSVQYHGPHE